MKSGLLSGIAGKNICIISVCLFCLICIMALFPDDSRAKSASEVFEIASRSTAVILGYDNRGKVSSVGSGVVIPDGSVATNCHVVGKAARLEIRYQNRQYPAAKLYTDWDRDVCSLKAQGLSAPPVRLGSTIGLKVGARVYAIGAPQGLELTISEGIVSGIRQIRGGQYIQTTAPISPGSSGGGLFDEEGFLIGLTTFYLAKGQNLNFALPVEWVNELPARHTVTARKKTSTVDWLNKALELQAKKDWPAMIAHCKLWLAAEPRSADAWSALGVAYLKSGQYRQAAGCFRKALVIDPKYANAWYNLGIAYAQSGLYRQAAECYRKALGINPKDEEAWYNLGIAYHRSGQRRQAAECYGKALGINPRLALAWANLGVVYSETGQKQKVKEVYQRLKSLDPELAERFFKKYVHP